MTSARQQLLKDFLENDSKSRFNMAKSQKPMFAKLSRSRRSKVVSTTVSAIQRAFNAVKHFHFINSVMSPSQLAWVTCTDVSVEVSVVKVRVKDILRWRSFKDLVRDESPMLDHCDSMMQWSGTSSPEEDDGLSRKGAQQGSPISILNFHFQEEGIQLFPSHKCIANMERRKNMFMHNSEDLEFLPIVEPIKIDSREQVYIEKKHYQEGNFEKVDSREQVHIEKKLYEEGDFKTNVDATKHVNPAEINQIALIQLFSDFYHNELATSTNENVFEDKMRMGKAWMNGEYEESCEWEVKGNKAACVREMDKDGRWSKFEEEKQELAVEVEIRVLDCLIDELLIDLVKDNF